MGPNRRASAANRSKGRNMVFGALKRGLLAAAFLILAVAARPRPEPGRFLQGQNVDLYIGYSAGGGYDLYARLLARHIGAHIPGNPTVVPKNMEGAGSLRLANWLYNVAPEGRHGVRHHRRAAPASIRCSASKARSSTPPSSTGSAAPTTRSASASPGRHRAASRNSTTC